MNSTTENELLWVDEKAIQNAQNSMIKAQIELNNFKDSCVAMLGPLSKDQMNKLKDQGFEYLDSEIRKLFQYPKAKRDFNLQALGIEPKDFNELSSKFKRRSWRLYEFKIVNGNFVAKEDQKIFQAHYYYADSEEKRQLIRVGQLIVDAVEDAKKFDMYRPEHFTMVSAAFNGLVIVDGDSRGKSDTTMKVNKKGIALYNPGTRKSYLVK